MTAVWMIVGFWAVVGAYSVAHNLRRIAEAIEAQNRAYGIGAEPATAEAEEAA